jgi:hypothetical protein
MPNFIQRICLAGDKAVPLIFLFMVWGLGFFFLPTPALRIGTNYKLLISDMYRNTGSASLRMRRDNSLGVGLSKRHFPSVYDWVRDTSHYSKLSHPVSPRCSALDIIASEFSATIMKLVTTSITILQKP